MSETKHTPGPWEVSDTRICLDGPLSSWNRTICDLGQYGSDGRICYPNAKANGFLIAAAPDMLDALKACPMFIRDGITPDAWLTLLAEWDKKRLATIAKAKGGAK